MDRIYIWSLFFHCQVAYSPVKNIAAAFVIDNFPFVECQVRPLCGSAKLCYQLGVTAGPELRFTTCCKVSDLIKMSNEAQDALAKVEITIKSASLWKY